MSTYLPWIAFATTLVVFAFLQHLRKKRVNFGLRTIIAMGFGLVIGFVFQGNTQYVTPFGTIFTQLIYAIVAPLLFFSIISSIASLNSITRLKTLGFRSVFWLLLNTLIASTITLIVATSLKLGSGFTISLPTDYVAREVQRILQAL